jgi:hypothetical protein
LPALQSLVIHRLPNRNELVYPAAHQDPIAQDGLTLDGRGQAVVDGAGKDANTIGTLTCDKSVLLRGDSGFTCP